jgi:hypothetical protein
MNLYVDWFDIPLLYCVSCYFALSTYDYNLASVILCSIAEIVIKYGVHINLLSAWHFHVYQIHSNMITNTLF